MKISAALITLVSMIVIAAVCLYAPMVADAGPGGKSYKGTITLKRTNSDPDNNFNESVQFVNLVLASTSDTPGKASWMNTETPTVTTSVNNQNRENPSISSPSQNVKAEHTGILLAVDRTHKSYSLTIGPVKQVPATIVANGETIKDVWEIQGQTAEEIALPADATHLKGSKTMKETNGAMVVVSWDLQL